MKHQLSIVLFIIYLFSCSTKPKVDLLVYNATIYTVDSSFSVAEALAANNGKIVAIGKTDSLMNAYDAKTALDAQKQFIYPGFIDAHTHFVRYGRGLQMLELVGTNSWEAILEKLTIFASKNKEGWLIGRGWDQNDWPVKEFPSKEKLDELFKERPVFLSRIDGHAAIANQKALDLGGIKAGDKLQGGEIETVKGKLTGILIDNAVRQVSSQIPSPNQQQIKKYLVDAQNNCFAVGLTTIDDCGLDYGEIMVIDSLQKSGDIKMRVYAMLSDDAANYNFLVKKGKIKTDRINVRSFKVYADGALGSRGACLLQPYTDKPGHFGFLLNTASHFDSVAKIIYNNGFQMCTHAIGDSANRTILKIYAKYLHGQNNRRWRIEHAQVINAADISIFGENSIIPSVQPTHATSDMYWAAARLGPERIKEGYAYSQLLKQNGWIPLGTDFPVESINPLRTFYSACIRRDDKGWPEQGFQMENALNRMESLKGITIWAARSNFEENEKGSLEKGKFADFVILSLDLMNAEPASMIKASVVSTYLNGEKVFAKQ